MSDNQFKIKDKVPDEKRVKEVLKSNYSNLEAIRSYIAETIGDTKEEWKFYGVKYGWNLKNFYKKRNLYFIGMYDGYFRIGFVFGERAFNSVMNSEVKDELKNELASAKKYAEGRGLTLEIKDDRYLNDIKILLQIKIDN
jgi:hypothetical protein